MIHRLKPHSPEWFTALKRFDSRQAEQTAQMIKMAGSAEVCSVCGDDPARDYEIVKPAPVDGSVATIRLCSDCVEIRSDGGEGFVPFA